MKDGLFHNESNIINIDPSHTPIKDFHNFLIMIEIIIILFIFLHLFQNYFFYSVMKSFAEKYKQDSVNNSINNSKTIELNDN